jgi:putative salt-induced outer membrane protein
MKKRLASILPLLTVALVATAQAEDKPTEFSLGLSYLATSGNSSSTTGGLDLSYKHTFDPWSIAVTGSYLRAESSGTETANRMGLGIRGDRTLSDRWKVFVEGSWLRDTFAGIDARYLLGAGVSYQAVKTDLQDLSFDLGVGWTSDHPVDAGTDSYASGLLGLSYTLKISPTAKLTEKLLWVPDLQDSQNWRVASDTGLESAIAAKLALKLDFQYLFDNVPVPGFKKTDTKTAVSLVVRL